MARLEIRRIDGELTLLIPLCLISEFIGPPVIADGDEDAITATLKQMDGLGPPYKAMRPTELLKLLDSAGYHFYATYDPKTRLRMYSSRLWHAAEAGGRLQKVGRGRYSVMPRLWAKDRAELSERIAQRLTKLMPLVATWMMAMTGWWLKCAQLHAMHDPLTHVIWS